MHEDILFFLVLDNPEITLLSVIDGSEIENNTAIIQCKVQSNPLSKVEWTFNNDTYIKTIVVSARVIIRFKGLNV